MLFSGGVTFVEMVQAADLRNRKDFADGLQTVVPFANSQCSTSMPIVLA